MRRGMGCSPSVDGSQSLMSLHIYTGLSNSPQFADERLEIESTSKIGMSSLHTKGSFTIHYPSLTYHHSLFMLTVASMIHITAKMTSSFVAWPPSTYPYIKIHHVAYATTQFFLQRKKKNHFFGKDYADRAWLTLMISARLTVWISLILAHCDFGIPCHCFSGRLRVLGHSDARLTRESHWVCASGHLSGRDAPTASMRWSVER